MASISQSYEGDCREGLAHGFGVARGRDYYRGKFRQGLPDGLGTYIWANGVKHIGSWKTGKCDGRGRRITVRDGVKDVVRGTWKNNKLVKKRQRPPYKITYIDGIERVRIYRAGPREMIEFYPIRHGNIPLIEHFRINNSSGTQNTSIKPYSVEYVTFPFEGTVMFSAPNMFNAYIKLCEVSFRINEPGRWIVEIYY